MTRETKLSIPQTEQYYFDEESKSYKPLAKDGVIPVTIVGGGTIGGSAMNFLNGSGAPTADLGNNGDVYLNADNGDLYKRENSSWSIIANLKGAKGDRGEAGARGSDGSDGQDGADGKSAYQIWLDAGNTGTEQDFLNSLRGAKGAKGDKGDKGDTGERGADGFGTEEQYNDIIARLEALENNIS